MITVTNLSKRYGDVVAVDDISFAVAPGRVTGFLGPNGAGKSTTMRMILGLDRPTSGSALVAGVPYAGLRSPLRTIGSLLDASAVDGGRSAADHLRWLAVSNDIEQTRLTLLSQPPDTLSRPFITVLVLWLCFIFASFSMSAKANPTLVVVLLICGFTAATAIYLILELGQPFDGLLQLSNSALSHALPPLR